MSPFLSTTPAEPDSRASKTSNFAPAAKDCWQATNQSESVIRSERSADLKPISLITLNSRERRLTRS